MAAYQTDLGEIVGVRERRVACRVICRMTYYPTATSADADRASSRCHHRYEVAQSHQNELRTCELSLEAFGRPRDEATLVSSVGGGGWSTTGMFSSGYRICPMWGSGRELSPSNKKLALSRSISAFAYSGLPRMVQQPREGLSRHDSRHRRPIRADTPA